MRIARALRSSRGGIRCWRRGGREDSGRERRGRGLDSSCTVNNTPPGRDRLAHPRHPATIYLLFVPYTFVSWPPLPSAVPGAVYRRGNWRRKTTLLDTSSPYGSASCPPESSHVGGIERRERERKTKKKQSLPTRVGSERDLISENSI